MYCHLSTSEPFNGIINFIKMKLSDKIPPLFKYPAKFEILTKGGGKVWQDSKPDFQQYVKQLIECSFCHSAWIAIPFFWISIGWVSIPVSYLYFVILKKLF